VRGLAPRGCQFPGQRRVDQAKPWISPGRSQAKQRGQGQDQVRRTQAAVPGLAQRRGAEGSRLRPHTGHRPDWSPPCHRLIGRRRARAAEFPASSRSPTSPPRRVRATCCVTNGTVAAATGQEACRHIRRIGGHSEPPLRRRVVHGVSRVRGARIPKWRRSGPVAGCGVRIGLSSRLASAHAMPRRIPRPRLAPRRKRSGLGSTLSSQGRHKPAARPSGYRRRSRIPRTAAPGVPLAIRQDSSVAGRDPTGPPSPTSRGEGDPRVFAAACSAAAWRVRGRR